MIASIPDAAILWLKHGERGSSSETIWSFMTGIPIDRGRGHHPLDPADLRRCRELVEKVPEWEVRLHEMREIDRFWATLVDHWRELCDLFDADIARTPDRAPTCYDRMKRLLDDAMRYA